MSIHVFPVGDVVSHTIEDDECVCGPELEAVQQDDGGIGWLYVHGALDGRE